MTSPAPPSPLRSWGTLGLLALGYIAIYLCRKNLAVAIPLLQEGFHVKKEAVGWIASAGTLAYAIGKVLNGPIIDRIGGRFAFLLAMAGVALFGGASAVAPGLGVIGALYAGNRFAGAAGWGAMLKLVPGWFERSRAATAIAILSLSYVAGGAIATLVARGILSAGGGYRVVLAGPALVVAAVAVLVSVTVRTGPFARAEAAKAPDAPKSEHRFSWAALGELVRRRDFLVACGLSFAITLIREAFNTWSVDFLTEIHGGTKALELAAVQSIGFDVAGAAGIVLMGAAYGKLAPPHRRWLLAASLVLLAAVLLVLPRLGRGHALFAAEMLAAIGFLVYGPYSLLSGVMALDTGGPRLVATAAGLVDGAGYLASALAGGVLGRLLDIGGYSLGFGSLAVTAIAAAFLSLFFGRPETPSPALPESTPA